MRYSVAAAIADARTAGKTADFEAIHHSGPRRQQAYQPFGDISIDFLAHANATSYRRELDLRSATARVTYESDGISFEREAFASYPDQVIVWRASANQLGAISFIVRLDSRHKTDPPRDNRTNGLIMSGQIRDGGLRFEARLWVAPGVRLSSVAFFPLTNQPTSGFSPNQDEDCKAHC